MQNYEMIAGATKQHRAKQGFLTWLMRVHATFQQRRTLMKLSHAQLKDVGITAAQAYRESQRSFWDISANCLKCR